MRLPKTIERIEQKNGQLQRVGRFFVSGPLCAKFPFVKKALSGGQWVTIHGHPVYIKGAPMSAQHAADIADMEHLSGTAKAAVLEAHAQGKLHTDRQVHGICADIAGALGVGLDESHAISEALASHGAAPKADAPKAGSGKTKKTTIKPAGKSAVTVVTHGAPVQEGEIADYGKKFGLDKDAVKLLEGAHDKGAFSSDTHFAQTVSDALHVASATGQTHHSALMQLLNGQSAEQVIELHQAGQITGQATPVSSIAPSLSSPDKHEVGEATPPLKSLGVKTKADFAAIPDVALSGEGPLPPLKSGQTQSAGIIIVEPDGKVWIYEPKDHFAGYEHTFSKGGVESGLTLQQSAHKELYEELGLSANITGVLGDFETPGTSTRYFIGVRTGGDPADAESGLTQPGAVETEKVKLVNVAQAIGMLNKTRDQQVLAALQLHLSANGNPHDAHDAPDAPDAPDVAPSLAPVAAPTALAPSLWNAHASAALWAHGVSHYGQAMSANAHEALGSAIDSGQVEDHHAAKILEVAASMANDDGKKSLDTGHIKKAVLDAAKRIAR